MEAKELMIGDFVEYGGKYLYYSGIFSDFTPLSNEPYRRLRCMFNDHEGLDIPETKVNPIPLTPEILEKNGFVSDACKCIWTYVENDIIRYEMVSASNGGYWFGEFIKIQYIHELQHALRLCGLNDLADNFKV